MASKQTGSSSGGSPAFETFAEHVRTGVGFKEITYDLELFSLLDNPDRERAIDLLIDQVAKHTDGVAAETLAELGASKAVPVLERMAHHPNPVFRVSVNRALVTLTGSAAAESRLADDVLLGNPFGAILGLDTLSKLDGAEALRGLLDGLEAPFKPARIQALDALQERFDVVEQAEPFTSPLWALSLYLLTDFPSMIALGAQGLRDIFTRLAAGATPDQLGLDHQPSQTELVEQVRTSLHDADSEIDVDAILALTGDERSWAEAQLVYNVSNKDPRAARAIGRLGLDLAQPALEDALKMFDGPTELLDAIADAIDELDS